MAAEAQCGGTPVVGAHEGGLPGAIGPGDVTLDIDVPVAGWVAAIRCFRDDEDHHARLLKAALAFSNRPKMAPDHQLGTLTEVLREARANRSERAA